MRLDYLHDFIDLANTLNFTKSSSNLHIAQSTLSRHILDLEYQVGATLFIRSTSNVKLTRAGKAFYEKATEIINDYDAIVDTLKMTIEDEFETVRIGGSTVQPTVNRLCTKLAGRSVAEGLPLRFEYGQTRSFSDESPFFTIDLLRSEGLDMVIEPLPQDSPFLQEFCSKPLFRERLLVFCSPDNPLAQRESLCLEDFLESTLVTLAVYQHCPALMSEPFRKVGLPGDHIKTVFIGNLLEIPEHLASLERNQVIALQEQFCQSFGFGQEGMHSTVCLPVHDERCIVRFYALSRCDDASDGIRDATALLDRIVEEYSHPAKAGEAWSSRLYEMPYAAV